MPIEYKTDKLVLNASEKDLIIALLKSLNMGNSGCVPDKINYAITQFKQLKEKGII